MKRRKYTLPSVRRAEEALRAELEADQRMEARPPQSQGIPGRVAELGPCDVDREDRRQWPRCAVCDAPCLNAGVFATAKGIRFRAVCRHDGKHVSQETLVTHTALKRMTDAGDCLEWVAAFHPGGEPLVAARHGTLRGRTRIRIAAPPARLS